MAARHAVEVRLLQVPRSPTSVQAFNREVGLLTEPLVQTMNPESLSEGGNAILSGSFLSSLQSGKQQTEDLPGARELSFLP